MKQFKQKAKRIFAAMLCLCMLASVLPIGASASDAVEYTWAASGKEFAQYSVTNPQTDTQSLVIDAVLEAGCYDALLTHSIAKSGSEFDFYFLPADTQDIAGAIATAQPVKTIDFKNHNNDSTLHGYTKVFGVNIPANGKYMLVAKYKSGDAWGGVYYFFTKKIKLVKVDGADRASFDFTVEANTEGNDKVNVMYGRSGYARHYVAASGANKAYIYLNMYKGYGGEGSFYGFHLGKIAGGDYKATFEHVKAGSGGKYKMYLIKVNTADTFGAFNTVHYALEGLEKGGAAAERYDLHENQKYLIEEFDFAADSAQYQQKAKFEINDLEAGDYWLVLENKALDLKYAYLQNFSMIPAGEEEEPKAEVPANDAIFGNTYAYVKDGTVYFIGGLKNIDGSEVGFEVTVNGNKIDDITTEQVYKSFTVNDETVNAEEWDSEYIFITSTTELEADDEVTVVPFIVKDGVKVYHAGLGEQLKLTI